MSMDALVGELRRLEVFRSLDDHQLAEVVRRAERIVFRAGQTIIEAGSLGDAAFVLASGEAEARLAGDPPEAAQPVAPGSLVGEMAMLIEHEHRLTVVARTSVRALRLTRAAMHAQMLADPDVAERFVQRISSRLTRMAVELRRVDQMLAQAAEPQPAAP